MIMLSFQVEIKLLLSECSPKLLKSLIYVCKQELFRSNTNLLNIQHTQTTKMEYTLRVKNGFVWIFIFQNIVQSFCCNI